MTDSQIGRRPHHHGAATRATSPHRLASRGGGVASSGVEPVRPATKRGAGHAAVRTGRVSWSGSGHTGKYIGGMERCDDAAERKLRCAPVSGRAGQFREASVAAVTPMESHLLAGRYRLLQPLGQGGMGMVWRARDELLGRDVAVKEVLVPAELPAGERAIVRERTLREARSAARLSHPNVVTIFDVVEESGRPWVVMEFVSSRPLADVVREDGPLPPRQVAEIGRQVLAALQGRSCRRGAASRRQAGQRAAGYGRSRRPHGLRHRYG